MQVILLERVEKLGNLGEEVSVKTGYARNFLLPQGKALRATPDNVAYFEKERAAIEAKNADKRKAAEKDAKNVDGLTVDLVRQASEGGQLYGSVAARDIADIVTEASKVTIARSTVDLNTNLKMLGLFKVTIALHPEVKVEVTVNIARSSAEADIQRKTGKALINVEEEAEAEERKQKAEAKLAAAQAEQVDATDADDADDAETQETTDEAAA
ncbi:MAG: 50S ribosomal protein L9 [Alphaproteobacteria bacterium]|nr:MAG: 50S ribosomal protein L9 [Alphaproteobacteria bacterium]